jgi:spore coat protein U-like protein
MIMLNIKNIVFMGLVIARGIGEAAAGCSVSTTGMSFGLYQPLTFTGKLTSHPVASDTTLRLSCQGIVAGGAYTIGLGPSSAGSGDRINTRYLANASAGEPIAFNIYQDPSHLTLWGDGVTGAALSGTIPVGDSNSEHLVYGTIPSGQSSLRAGSYSDTLVVTLTYMP